MSTPNVPPTPTWLATFTVQVDLPITMAINDMEGYVAFGVVQYLKSQGLTGNCVAKLTATQGNVSVANPTPAPVPVVSKGPPPAVAPGAPL